MKDTPQIRIINNQEGSALLLALILMSVLTIMGLTSISTTSTEYQIVRNERLYQTNFYHAESCANEAAFYLEDENDTDDLIPAYTSNRWLNDVEDETDFTDPGTWSVGAADTNNAGPSNIPNIGNSSYSVVAEGPRDNSSLDIGSSRLYEFEIYGKSDSGNGTAMVEIGYLKRF